RRQAVRPVRLSRATRRAHQERRRHPADDLRRQRVCPRLRGNTRARRPRRRGVGPLRRVALDDGLRSEEHTSELQSLTNLVCRLLLEKKKLSTHQSHFPGELSLRFARRVALAPAFPVDRNSLILDETLPSPDATYVAPL